VSDNGDSGDNVWIGCKMSDWCTAVTAVMTVVGDMTTMARSGGSGDRVVT
jgi:hypothetical protein